MMDGTQFNVDVTACFGSNVFKDIRYYETYDFSMETAIRSSVIYDLEFTHFLPYHCRVDHICGV